MADPIESQPGREDDLQFLNDRISVLGSLVDNTLDILTIVSAEGLIQYVNPAVTRVLGYEPAELIGTNLEAIIHPNDKTITDQVLSDIYARGTRYATFRTRLRHKNGEWRWLAASGNILESSAGTNQIIANLHDITDSKKLEEILRQKVEALAALQATAADLTLQQDWLTLLNAIVERARTLISAPSGFIYLYDSDTEELALTVDQAYLKTPGIRLKMGEGMAGWVAQHRQPLILGDYSAWDNRSNKYNETPFHGVIEVPMLYGGQLIGVLGANESQETPHKFNEADLQILSLFAAQAASIVHNARLLNSLQHELEERKKAEGSFRSSEERFRNSFTNAPIGMALVDAQENFLQVNQTLCEMLGYTEEELLKTNVPALTYPDDLLVEATYKDQTTAGAIKSFYLEKRYLHKDGHIVWGKLSVSAVKDETNKILYYIGQLEDITERKSMEQALHQRVSELEAIQANVIDLTAQKELLPLLETIIGRGAQLLNTPSGFIYLYDQTTNELILTAERGHSLSVGKRLKMGEGMAGRVALTRTPLSVDDYAQWLGRSTQYDGIPYKAILEVPMLFNNELIGVLGVNTVDNSTHTFSEADARLLATFAGQAANAVHNARLVQGLQLELTERKKIEEALRDSEARFRSIYENATIGIYRTTPEGRILINNPALLRMLGFASLEELSQRNLEHEGFETGYERKTFLEIMEAKNEVQGFESAWKRKDGSTIYVRESARSVRDENGKLLYFEGTVEDISDKKHAEQIQTALYRIAEASLNTQTLDELFPRIHAIVHELMPAKNFYIALHDPVDNLLHFPYFVDEVDATPQPRKVLGNGLTEYVLISGKPLLAKPEVYQDLEAAGQVISVGAPSIDWLGVPLKTRKGETLGVMVTQTYHETERYSEAEKDILVFVSTQVAMAIDHKRAEEYLRANEKRLRHAQAIAHVGNWELDIHNRKIWGSEEAFQIYGLERKTAFLPLDAVQSMVLPEYRSAVDKALNDLITQKAEYDVEFQIRRASDGTTRALHSRAELVCTPEGIPYKVLGVIQDITERKQVELARRRSETFSRSIIENEPECVKIINPDGTLQYMNPAGLAMIEVDRLETVQGKQIYSIVTPGHRNAFIDLTERVLKGEHGRLEFEIVGLRGTRRWLDTHAVPLYDEHGHIEGVLGLTRDITEQKRAGEIIRESQQRLTLLVEQSPLAVIEWDPDFKVISWNPAAEKIFGFTFAEARGRHASELIVPQEVVSYVDQIWDQLINQRGGTRSSNENITKDGRRIACEWYNTPLINPDGSVIGVASLVDDVTERKRAEQELRASETRYRAVVENQTEFIVRCKPDGTRTFVNDAYCRYFGLTPEQALGISFLPLVSGDDPEAVIAKFKRLTQDDIGIETDIHRVIKPDGSIGWQEWTEKAIRDENGQVVEFQSVGRDITERIRSDEMLRESEKKFRLIAETIDEVFWMADPEIQKIHYVSQNYQNIWGRTPASLYEDPQSFFDAIHPDDRAYVLAGYTVKNEGLPINHEYRVFRPDGTMRWIWDRGFPVRNETGTIIHYVGAASDITERKLAQQAEVRRRQLLEKVIELGKAVTQIKNLDECLRKVHTSIQKDLGFDRVGIFLYRANTNTLTGSYGTSTTGEIEDTSWFSQSVTDNPSWQDVLSSPRGLSVINDYREKYPDLSDENEMRNVHQHITFSAWVGDTPMAVIALDNAISQRLITPEEIEALQLFAGYIGLAIQNARLNTELEQRVLERTRQLEDANKELESFSYSVSHDLRAPLRAISSYARIFEEDYGPSLKPEAATIFNNIRGSAQNMNQLIEDLLKFSRLGRHALVKQMFNPLSLIQQALETLAHEQVGRQIEIVLGELPTCEGDPTLLLQVWINLISNALKYTRQRSVAKIEIGSLIDEQKQPIYFVRDNGIGFDMRYADKLFRVFQRLHGVDEFEGTGIGLALVQRIIARHGGRIWAESQRNVGTTFYFTL